MGVKNKVVMTMAVLSGVSLAVPLNANAKTNTYKRTKTTKVAKKAYYTTNTTASTYKANGKINKWTFKKNHALKNYKNTTWTRTQKTYISMHGKKVLYYWVHNSKNNATGWIWSGYLKAGKNYQGTTAKAASGSYQKNTARNGKIYTFKPGGNSYIKFTKPKSIATKTTYTRSKTRTVYKAGKSYTYYYVTSANKKTKGWVWNKYMKSGAYKKATSTAAKTSSTSSSVASQSSSSTASLTATSKTSSTSSSKASSSSATTASSSSKASSSSSSSTTVNYADPDVSALPLSQQVTYNTEYPSIIKSSYLWLDLSTAFQAPLPSGTGTYTACLVVADENGNATGTKGKTIDLAKTKTVSPAEYEALTGYDLSDFEN